MEYKITKEQILDGAKKCPTAEGVLKAMFPDAFENEWVRIPMSEVSFSGYSLMHDGFYVFNINPKPIGGMNFVEYKISGNGIYRRKK